MFSFMLAHPAWNVAAAAFIASGDTSGEAPSPAEVTFKPDGTKCYIGDTPNIYQYSLGTAWDITTLTYDSKTFDVGAGIDFTSLAFSADGTKMYLSSSALTKRVRQYSLSGAWDVSTASYDSKELDFASEDAGAMRAIDFNADGDTLILLGGSTDAFFQYTLSTPWDISTGSYDSKTYDFDSGISTNGGFVDNDGIHAFATTVEGGIVYVRSFIMSTGWDVSTMFELTSSKRDIDADSSGGTAVGFHVAGLYMYVLDNSSEVHQYAL